MIKITIVKDGASALAGEAEERGCKT